MFSDDVRQIEFGKESDDAFSILTIVCMAIYTVEIVVLCLVKEGYFLRYYFWVDVISTATMVFDITWVFDAILTSGQGDVHDISNTIIVARASRATRIGTQSTKFIRILRILRILRLFKTATTHMNKEN